MGVGNFLGNLLGAVLAVVAALTGFISLEASVIAFAAIAYGFWLCVVAFSFSLGRVTSEGFKADLNLTKAEIRAFRRYNMHIIAPGAGESVSAMFNLLRLAGVVWAGLCVWQGQYVLAGFAAAFFFVSGGIILRTDPFLHMERAARGGDDVAAAELRAIQSCKAKRDRFFTGLRSAGDFWKP